MAKKVSVMVVDDSPLCRQLIVDALGRDPDIEVIAQAENGQQAYDKAAALKPQVITMDVDMPVMDGLSATEKIMAEHPTPILVLTADPRNQAPELTHRALAVGALALQVKPAMDAGPDAWNLAREVKLLSTVKVIRHLRGTRGKGATPSSPGMPAAVPVADSGTFAASPVGVVAIASSTGGPQVVQKLLADLPPDFPAPVVLVQHINAAFAESLVSWLAATSKLKVKVAKDGDLLTPGTVLIAPADAHLTIPSRGRVAVQPGTRERRPPAVGHAAARLRREGLRAARGRLRADGHGRRRCRGHRGDPRGRRQDDRPEPGVVGRLRHARRGDRSRAHRPRGAR